MKPRDYDATLARIAGNIAAGYVGACRGLLSLEAEKVAADVAVRIARAIIEECREAK